MVEHPPLGAARADVPFVEAAASADTDVHPELPPDLALLASAPPPPRLPEEEEAPEAGVVVAVVEGGDGDGVGSMLLGYAGAATSTVLTLSGHLVSKTGSMVFTVGAVALSSLQDVACGVMNLATTQDTTAKLDEMKNGLQKLAGEYAAVGRDRSIAAAAEFFARLRWHQRRALPGTLEARVPEYWWGLDTASSRLSLVPVRTKRGAFEALLKTSSAFGGRDLMYAEPKGYKDLSYAAAWRIENPELYLKYDAEKESLRANIRRAAAAGIELPDPNLHQALKEAAGELPATLDAGVNEVWLVHGTSPASLLQIISSGFNERLCARAIFGSGVYFAEDVAKADQYVQPDRNFQECADGDTGLSGLHKYLYPGGEADHPQDVFYVLVCRVMLGVCARTRDGKARLPESGGGPTQLWRRGAGSDRDVRELADIPGTTPGEPFHSLIVETGGPLVRFREFVMFHAETRAYPEYLVAYRRVPPRLP